jgi:hypothetical protein
MLSVALLNVILLANLCWLSFCWFYFKECPSVTLKVFLDIVIPLSVILLPISAVCQSAEC